MEMIISAFTELRKGFGVIYVTYLTLFESDRYLTNSIIMLLI